jgi:hypothetical protein
MNIIPSIITKYAYVEKDNDWIDPDSLHSQHHLVGNVPIEDILQRMNQGFNLPKSLENYGVPVGLLVMPQTCSQMQGGGGIKKKHQELPHTISDNDHERLMKFIHIYTDKGIKNKNDKTHKKRK